MIYAIGKSLFRNTIGQFLSAAVAISVLHMPAAHHFTAVCNTLSRGKCITLPANCNTKAFFSILDIYLCIAMKHVILISLMCLTHAVTIMSQTPLPYDTIIDRGVYRSYFNSKFSTVSFVRYTLYRGGGTVSRKGMAFRHTYGHSIFPYLKSGYDKGHLAAAQDFAYSKSAMLATFDYINALPQAPALNRGAWKRLESKVRKWSQPDTLMIECGGLEFDSTRHMVPKYFYKIVTRHQGRDTLANIIYLNK